MAGYSSTPLPRKLGITPESRVLVAGAPPGFDLGELPPGAEVHGRVGRASYDVILGFCPDHATLLREFGSWRTHLVINGGLWIAWPKKSGGMATDLTETMVREYGLAQGLVDNKVAAVDAVWAGLRFVVRVADR